MSGQAGSLGTEASQLLDVLAERLAQVRENQRGGDGESGARPGADAPVPCPQCGHDPAAVATCTGCPLCALLSLLRGERPDAAAKLADGALAIVQVLRGLLAGGDGPAADGPTQDDSASGDVGRDGDVGSDDRARGDCDDDDDDDDDAPAPRETASRTGRLVRIDIR